jgi:hypothetical protein
MMSGVPLEARWTFNKLWNNKLYYKAASCWYFYWIMYDARIHEYQTGATLPFEIPRFTHWPSSMSFCIIHFALITGTHTSYISIPYYDIFCLNSEIILKQTVFSKSYRSPPISVRHRINAEYHSTAHNRTIRNKIAQDSTKQYRLNSGNTWQYETVQDKIRQRTKIPDIKWNHMATPPHRRRFITFIQTHHIW